jgi:hypothetical protein
MKLIDMLVEDGLNGWQWPDGVECITQDNGSSIYKGVAFGYHKAPYLKKNIWLANNGTGHADAKIKKYDVVADDWDTAIITREQYESALAAKNEGWIEWGGGECPVPCGTIVDVKHRCGAVSENQQAWPKRHKESDVMVNPLSNAGQAFWRHENSVMDIIAYRLHNTNEAEKVRASAWSAYAGITEADDESDLNECIGQATWPLWNGEGLVPPVGCVCERSWAGDEWLSCRILFASDQIVVIKLEESGIEDAYNIGDVTFRPIRPEAERRRDDICDKIYGAMTNAKRKDNRSDMAEEIYDAIAAGKIPGLRLED